MLQPDVRLRSASHAPALHSKYCTGTGSGEVCVSQPATSLLRQSVREAIYVRV